MNPLLEPLVPHSRVPDPEFAIGPGWVPLARACHDAVVAEFPSYELLAVKQKYATLDFQAFPRPWKPGGDWTDAEYDRLHEIIDSFTTSSAATCERCGSPGSLREARSIELTLCDECDHLVPDGRWIQP